jgi:hypothetical protein
MIVALAAPGLRRCGSDFKKLSFTQPQESLLALAALTLSPGPFKFGVAFLSTETRSTLNGIPSRPAQLVHPQMPSPARARALALAGHWQPAGPARPVASASVFSALDLVACHCIPHFPFARDEHWQNLAPGRARFCAIIHGLEKKSDLPWFFRRL